MMIFENAFFSDLFMFFVVVERRPLKLHHNELYSTILKARCSEMFSHTGCQTYLLKRFQILSTGY